ncbi:MAG: NAD(P)-dependent oxidoreductase [Roseburia sp.]|nr:NAD(P)-dependent oxidoreductase [Roseburia sp.]MCM1278807.1 NAD(P)-dependent oxidoreductase [Robinsoniella sp.]
MKDAVITGANGFIGSAILKMLVKNNIKVYAVVRNRESLKEFWGNSLVDIIESDFAHYEKELPERIPKDVDVFYHIAWEGAYGPILGDYTQQIKNIQYTCDAITMAHKLQCKKFIMAGTINELELLQFFHAEKDVPRKACIYGISKLSCDLMCKTLANEYGILYNTAIIGSCFGPGDRSKRIHNVFISNMLNGTRPKLISKDTLHDWIYIDDVAEMFMHIGDKSVNMKNYYLGHNYLRKLEDILYEVRDILNPKVELVFGEIESSFLIDYSLVDLNSVYEDTDYVCKTDFKEAVLKTADWIKEIGLNK